MKKREFLKKILAFVCVITMMTASLGLQMLVDASDTTNFTELTFATCGIGDNSYTADKSGNHPNGKAILDNVAFTGNIQFVNKTNDWNDALIFGGKLYLTYNSVTGELQLCNRVNNTYLHKIKKSELGADPSKTLIRIRFTFEYVSGTTDQVKYTFSANDVYNEGTITVAHSSVGAWMMVKVLAGETIVESVYPKVEGEEDITSPTELSFVDCGINDGTYSSDKSGNHPEGKGMLDNVAFTGNIQFSNKTNDWNDALIFAGKVYLTYNSVTGELQLCNRVNNTYLHKIKKSELGADPGATPIRVRLTFEYVSGTTDQVKYTFSANNVYNEGTITVAHSSIGAWVMVKVVNGETIVESVTEDDLGLEELSFADFTISDGMHTATSGGDYPSNIENTVLKSDTNFCTGTGESIIYGGTSQKGLRIVHVATGKLKVIADNNVASNLLNEAELETNSNNDNAVVFAEPSGVDFESNMSLSVSVEKGNYDSDAEIDDAKVGIWVNGKLLGKKYLYLADAFDGSHMTNECYVSGGSDGMTVKSLEPDTSDSRKINASDLNLDNNKVVSATDSLLNTEVSMKVQANNTNVTSEDGYAYIDYGEGTSKFKELTFADCGISDGTYTADKSGNHPDGKAILDNVAFTGDIQFADKTNDWNDALIFGGKLYLTYDAINGQLQLCNRVNNTYLHRISKAQLGADPSTTPIRIRFTFEFVSGTTDQVKYTFSANNVYNEGTITVAHTSIGAWVMVKRVNGETTVSSVYDVVDNGTPGVRIQVMNDKLVVNQTSGLFDSFEIPASVLGVDTFSNKQFDLKMSYTMIDFDHDEEKDEVRFSISVNGKTCANRYFEDFDLQTNRYMSIHENQSKVTVKDTEFDSTDFETLTIEDFGMEPTEFKYNGGALQGHHSYTGGNLDGKIFTTNIKFSTYDALFFYGSKTLGSWYSLYVGPQDGAGTNAEKDNRWRFLVSYPEGILGSTQFIDATDAGVKLANNTFELGISTRNVDCDGDKQVDDLELGLWFNGKLLENSYIYAIDKADTLQPNFAVLIPTDRGSVTIGNIVETVPTEIEHCADKYGYMVDADSSTIETIEGAAYPDDTTVITIPGVYNVTYKDAGSTYMDKVVVFVEQDATADGIVDVRDLVRLKLFAKNPGTKMDTAGKKALSVVDGILPDNAMADMHTRLLNSNVIGAKEMSSEIVGEMGPAIAPTGSYITGVDQTIEGTAVISVSGNQDSKWKSTLVNSKGTGLDYILDFDEDREIKILQMSDTQIRELTDIDTMLWQEMDELIRSTKPDLVLVAGDLIYGQYDPAAGPEDLDNSSMKLLADRLDGYRIPWAPILGNHELESNILAQGICEIFENSKYCLFTRRGEIGGNGNYAIGIAKNGVLAKTIFMMDSNGSNKNANELPYVSNDSEYIEGENIIGIEHAFLFFDNQMAWYRTVSAKVKAFAKETVKSFLCVHVPPEEVRTAVQDMGLEPTDKVDWGLLTTEGNPDATIGWRNSHDGLDEEDGGKKMNDYIYPYLLESGTDGVFFGHCHANAMSTVWKGIRWTYGMKTGMYEPSPGQDGTGGTLITIKSDASSVIEHKVLTGTAAN